MINIEITLGILFIIAMAVYLLIDCIVCYVKTKNKIDKL